MSKQYMTARNVWIGSYGDDTPCEIEGAVPAPADPAGFHGADGLCWRAETQSWEPYVPPPDSCTRLQGLLALGMERAWQLEQLVLNLPTIRPDLTDAQIWALQTTYRNAQTWERLHPFVEMIRVLFGMTTDERDDLIRLAVTL